MDQSKPEVDELALIRSKLKQASRQLIQKNLEITALKEELALRRREDSLTSATKVVPAAFNIVYFGWDIDPNEFTMETAACTYPHLLSSKSSKASSVERRAEMSLSTGGHVPAQTTSGDCCLPEQHDKLSHGDAWANPSYDPSPIDFDEISLTSVDWDDNCTATWAASWNNIASDWGAGESFQTGEYQKENWRKAKLRTESKSWLHTLCFGRPAHTISDMKYKDIMDLHTLPLTTRLEDDDWLDSDLGHVRIDDERLFRLLTRGRELAQKCSGRSWTKPSRRSANASSREAGNKSSWSAELARNAVFAVVPLRHLTCHWNESDLGWSRPAPRTVELHLKKVQKLAIHLYDEERAAEARKLRDEARQAVEDTVSEMDELEPLFEIYA